MSDRKFGETLDDWAKREIKSMRYDLETIRKPDGSIEMVEDEPTPPPTTTEEASDEYVRGFEAGCAFVMARNEENRSQPPTVVIPRDFQLRDDLSKWLMDLRILYGRPGSPIALNHNFHWAIVEKMLALSSPTKASRGTHKCQDGEESLGSTSDCNVCAIPESSSSE